MSDTPRTDAARHDEHDPYMAIAAECSKLERELNTAKQHIERLEEAGDKLYWLWMHPFDTADETIGDNWRKAKEAKP